MIIHSPTPSLCSFGPIPRGAAEALTSPELVTSPQNDMVGLGVQEGGGARGGVESLRQEATHPVHIPAPAGPFLTTLAQHMPSSVTRMLGSENAEFSPSEEAISGQAAGTSSSCCFGTR